MFEHFFAIRPFGRIVAGDFVLMGIESSDESRQTGAAQAAGNVSLREQSAVSCQAIEMRRLNDCVPHKAEVGPGLVIRDD